MKVSSFSGARLRSPRGRRSTSMARIGDAVSSTTRSTDRPHRDSRSTRSAARSNASGRAVEQDREIDVARRAESARRRRPEQEQGDRVQLAIDSRDERVDADRSALGLGHGGTVPPTPDGANARPGSAAPASDYTGPLADSALQRQPFPGDGRGSHANGLVRSIRPRQTRDPRGSPPRHPVRQGCPARAARPGRLLVDGGEPNRQFSSPRARPSPPPRAPRLRAMSSVWRRRPSGSGPPTMAVRGRRLRAPVRGRRRPGADVRHEDGVRSDRDYCP